MRRLVAFLRSVTPEDPYQLLLVAGAMLLMTAHSMNFLPSDSTDLSSNFYANVRHRQLLFVLLLGFPFFAALAAYFACFWPGKHGTRRILIFVALPTFAFLVLYMGLMVIGGQRSIFDVKNVAMEILATAVLVLPVLPHAFWVCLAGVIVCGIFVARLVRGRSRLPLAWPDTAALGPSDAEVWRGICISTYIVVGPLVLIQEACARVLWFAIPRGLPTTVPMFPRALSILYGGILVATSVMALGRAGSDLIRRALHLPRLRLALLGLATPVLLQGLVPLAHFLLDRIDWAAHSFGRIMPPTIGEYFGSFNLFLLFLAFGALAEEIVFRGILQTKFIQFFGQFRGIFLVSLVWAAYHFPFASYWNLSDAAIVGHVFTRVLSCLALGFVFSWLTLKSHSVLPSALAHFVFNVFASLGIRDAFSGSHLLTLTLWAVFAYVLFRYRPVEEAKQTDIQLPVVNPEPAT